MLKYQISEINQSVSMKLRHSDISTFHYKVVLVFLLMYSDLFEVVREGRISDKIRHLEDRLWVYFWLV